MAYARYAVTGSNVKSSRSGSVVRIAARGRAGYRPGGAAMPERRKLSSVEVLSLLVERVRRIESDAKTVCNVLERMIQKQESRRQQESG